MHSREELLALIRDGVSVTAAARQRAIPRATIYSWKARNPEFGAALSEAVRAKRVVTPVDPDAPLPDRAELLRRLDEQSRNGSTTATAMLLRALAEEPAASATTREVMALSLLPRS